MKTDNFKTKSFKDIVVDENLYEKFGVTYFEPGEQAVFETPDYNLYYYKAYVGAHTIEIEKGDCAYWIGDEGNEAFLTRGPATIKSQKLATVIRGYMPETKSSTLNTLTCLPYINGCSTKQIFPPDRLGDPTLQMLHMPPYTSEQAHHVHPTARVVYVQSGFGYSIVGMDGHNTMEELYPGKVCILNKMCPHHFKTESESLTVIPLHVWSSVPGMETNHPMFNGTHRI